MDAQPAEASRGATLKRAVVAILKYAAAFGVLTYLYQKGSIQLDCLKVSTEAIPAVSLGVALVLAGMMIAPLRYYILLRTVDIRVSFAQVARIGLMGNFLNIFLLGSLGCDVARYAYITHDGGSRSAAAAATILDRVIGLFSVFLLAALVLAFQYRSVLANDHLKQLSVVILGLVGASVAGGLAVWYALPACLPEGRVGAWVTKKLPGGGKLAGMAQVVAMFRNRWVSVLVAGMVSLLLQGLTVLSIYAFGRASSFESPPSVAQVCFATPIAFMANAVPLPGGGLGAGEAAFEQALRYCPNDSHRPVEGGASIFLFWRCWSILLALVGLPLCLARFRANGIQRSPPSNTSVPAPHIRRSQVPLMAEPVNIVANTVRESDARKIL